MLKVLLNIKQNTLVSRYLDRYVRAVEQGVNNVKFRRMKLHEIGQYDDSCLHCFFACRIFLVGNRNSAVAGTSRGEASGFNLDILPKLKDVKSKVSVCLHCVAVSPSS